jgi:hypothetical protein
MTIIPNTEYVHGMILPSSGEHLILYQTHSKLVWQKDWMVGTVLLYLRVLIYFCGQQSFGGPFPILPIVHP